METKIIKKDHKEGKKAKETNNSVVENMTHEEHKNMFLN